jgi:hypothetical protein
MSLAKKASGEGRGRGRRTGRYVRSSIAAAAIHLVGVTIGCVSGRGAALLLCHCVYVDSRWQWRERERERMEENDGLNAMVLQPFLPSFLPFFDRRRLYCLLWAVVFLASLMIRLQNIKAIDEGE